jgi:hypothetical protein
VTKFQLLWSESGSINQISWPIGEILAKFVEIQLPLQDFDYGTWNPAQMAIFWH